MTRNTQTPNVIVFTNGKGQKRYQPVLPSGRRRYRHPQGQRVGLTDAKGIWAKPGTLQRPLLFRTRWQAYFFTRLAEQLRARELKTIYTQVRT